MNAPRRLLPSPNNSSALRALVFAEFYPCFQNSVLSTKLENRVNSIAKCQFKNTDAIFELGLEDKLVDPHERFAEKTSSQNDVEDQFQNPASQIRPKMIAIKPVTQIAERRL